MRTPARHIRSGGRHLSSERILPKAPCFRTGKACRLPGWIAQGALLVLLQVCAGILLLLPSCGGELPDAPPRFTFAAIGDPHIAEQGSVAHNDYRYCKALEICAALLRNAVSDINAHSPSPDFVFVLGDISDHGYLAELELAKAILDSLRAPYYVVRGNHDARCDFWETVFGEGTRSYTLDQGGVHFIVADCATPKRGGVEIEWTRDVREWVRADIEAHAGAPVFFVTHANLYERSWSAAFDSRDTYGLHPGAVELRDLLSSSGNVVAVVSGHVHANRLEVHDGLPCVEVGSTCVARASVRYFQVFADRTEMTYERLSDASLQEYAEWVARCSPRLEDVDTALELIEGREDDRVAVLAHPVHPIVALEPTAP
jgi:predicted phosphodiesterase